VDGKLLQGLLHINETQLQHVFRLGIDNGPRETRRIAILGTAFKPNTDDIRESPGIKLAEMALDRGLQVSVQDYIALDNTRHYFGTKVDCYEDPLEAIRNADIVFVTTIWPQYREISDSDFEKAMPADAVMVDTRSHFKDRPDATWRFRIGVGK
jgi:UDP-glucose 6-dehydrogenase